VYGERYYQGRESWPDFRVEMEAIRRLARLAPESRVLELGCGGGELLRSLSRSVRLAVGVDLSPVGLRLARGEKRLAAVRARAEQLPFAERTFDALVAQHLVEHLRQPDEALRGWGRVLKPSGILVLITPNALHPDPSLFDDPGHVTLFTPSTLRSTLEAAGFEVTHLSTLFPYLGRARLARSASIRLARLPRCVPPLAGSGRTIVAAAVVRTLPPELDPEQPQRRDDHHG
jgi:ubiquinone/menaquinone biosynthesis C-methylase UbiE